MFVKRTVYWIFLFSIIITFSKTASQPLHFSKETIEVKIYDGYVVVNGVYTFNTKSRNVLTRTLYYPFPITHAFHYPDSIFVSDKNNKAIPFSKSSSGIFFSLNAIPDSETTINISYLQRILSDTMKYILTTTQQWKHPLEKAEYKILLPLEFELKSLSLNPYQIDSDSAHNIYYINKENFMPETDLIVAWSRRKNVK